MQVHEIGRANQISFAEVRTFREKSVEGSQSVIVRISITTRDVCFEADSWGEAPRHEGIPRIGRHSPSPDIAGAEAPPLKHALNVVVPWPRSAPESRTHGVSLLASAPLVESGVLSV